MPPPKPEVMAPAGHWPQLLAAIEAGADAVYFGLTRFTARAKTGFAPEELPEAVRTLHRRGVKAYVTYNTLVWDDELVDAARGIETIAGAGADAIIVQDWAVARLARRIAPSLEVHGSTQMSVTSAEGAEMARRLGVSRVVLARELSLAEIRAVRAQTPLELEIFVHGALCVSYSGQCFSSEAWGGRSANRGQCAQACRLPYEVIVDGAPRPLGEARYPLSPGDLYAMPLLDEILEIGVSALKIEGRYKDAEYVALTTRAYRRAVDGIPPTPAEELQLEQAYSRGLGPWFLQGVNHQQVVEGRIPRHRGVRMGTVRRVTADSVHVEPSPAHTLAPLKPGDGAAFDAASWRSPEEPEEGGRLYEVSALPDGCVELRFANGAVDFSRIRPGDLLWRTADPETTRAARPYMEPAAPVARRAVDVAVRAQAGRPLETWWRLGWLEVRVESPAPLGEAAGHPLGEALLRAQLGRLGNTPYELGALEARIEGRPFAPASLLNQIRREAVERLQELQQGRPHSIEVPAADAVAEAVANLPRRVSAARTPKLHLLVRSPAQLEAAITLRPGSITLDYLDLYGLKPSVERVRTAGIEVRAAAPRILKPSEQRVVHFLRKLGCPILVRSAGLLEAFRSTPGHELHGDFSLNAANAVSAAILLDMGLARLAPTHDLNARQIRGLAAALPAEAVEVIAYHHLPVFHTEHCVFCRFLSAGTSHEDCGHPCEQHQVELRDAAGRAHPVLADVGCRNTVFGAEAQQAAPHLASWLAAGIAHYRLEFAHEKPEEIKAITEAFREALGGRISAGELERRLRRHAPQGITQGSFFIPASSLAGTR